MLSLRKPKLLLLSLLVPTLLCALPCGHIGAGDEGPQTLATHRCLGLSFGGKTVEGDTLTYKGLQLGLAHASMNEEDIQRAFIQEQCHLRGCSIQLFAQDNVGDVSGVTLSGLMSATTHHAGLQLSGLANRTQTTEGVQIGLAINRAEEKATGVQVGLINLTKELHGVQLGLINVNSAGWFFPLINIGW